MSARRRGMTKPADRAGAGATLGTNFCAPAASKVAVTYAPTNAPAGALAQLWATDARGTWSRVWSETAVSRSGFDTGWVYLAGSMVKLHLVNSQGELLAIGNTATMP